MSLKEQVYSILVISSFEKFNTAIAELLPPSQYQPVHIVTNAGEGKRCSAERNFDFIIINVPLPDESGVRLAIDFCHSRTAVVLLLAKNDVYSELHDKVAEYGVFTLPKPTSRTILAQALNWMSSARERLRKLEEKTCSIEERMEQIRIVNRAKCLLISELNMSESEAHRYIEKNAMDCCISKKEAAQKIIRLYA